MATSPQLSQSNLAALAQALGVSPQELQSSIAANASTSGYNPFALTGSAQTGTLYLGQKQTTTPQGIPLKTHTVTSNFAHIPLSITMPDFGSGYTVDINSTMGSALAAGALEGANANMTKVWAEVKDASGKVVYKQDITAQVGARLGMSVTLANGVVTTPGAITGENSKGQPNPIEVNLNQLQAEGGGIKPGGTADSTGTIEDQLKGLYNMDPKTLRNFKHELWVAGYYGQVPLDRVNMNVMTDLDVQAFSQLMVDSARYYQAGKKITWQSLLQQQATDPTNVKASEASTTGPLTDPEAITVDANTAATKLLGHAASPKDVQTLIAMIHGQETAHYASAHNANTVYAPDETSVQNDITQYFREQYPNEALSVDWGSAANEWAQMLAKNPSEQPTTVK